MPLDMQSLLYGPLYATWGVPATLTVGSTPYPVTVIDQTAGVQLAGTTELETMRPAAAIRVSDLEAFGITAAQLDGQSISFNGNSWTIVAWRPKPSPNGEADGEYLLLLEGASEA